MFVRLKLTTAGESHGPKLCAIVEGLPAGLRIDFEALDALLARRQRGFGAGGRMKLERDAPIAFAGAPDGRTTGAPLALEIANVEWPRWRERDIEAMTRPRPGHADLTAALKHGYDDLRFGLERASARETAARVAAGGVALQLLQACGVEIGARVVAIGAAEVGSDDAEDPGDGPAAEATWRRRWRAAHADDLGASEAVDAAAFRAEVQRAIAARDSVGGIIEVVAIGLPPGLGTCHTWHGRLDGRLAQALMAIPSVKGVEFGAGFAQTRRLGTEVHDAIDRMEDGTLRRRTNRCGGLEAGMSTGAPLVVHIGLKPIATTLRGIDSVDLVTGEAATTAWERSDICAVPRALPIAEAVLALVLADALLERVGGDRLSEVQARTAALPRAHLDALALHGGPWRFGPRVDRAGTAAPDESSG